MVEELRLNLLGSLEVTLGGTPLRGFISSKSQAMLCYLAVSGRAHSRQALAGLLWGDMPEEAASANLRVALSNLRRLVPEHLLITRQSVAFNRDSPYWLDVERFQASLQTNELTSPEQELEELLAAAELYRGDFLDGFFVRDAQPFEEWMLGQRERLRRLALQALHTLSLRLTARRDYAAAIRFTGRLLSLEPWQEEAHRQMMLLLALSGQRSAALAQYETCRRLLAEELGVEPTEETTSFYERIREGDVGEPADVQSLALPVSRPHNLPVQLTSFIGREAELAQIAERLASPACRLLTLVGPGGIGKTRLAIQAASEHLAAGPFPDGVHFVPLAPVSAEFLVSTLADALSFSFYSPEDPQGQLLNYLREKRLLLVLDGFEHLRAKAIELVLQVLSTAPGVKLLVTSRERLNIAGEYLLPIQGLPFPPSEDVEQVQAYGAVELFVQSASRVDATFSLSPAHRTAVARICRLVEGMPLALEIAAAWVRDFSCEEIAHEIARSLDFLNTALEDMPARHQSLRVVFDYSWSLLSAEERAIFRKLSLFRGGFSRDAAAVVAGASPRSLAVLGDKSLLRRVSSGRYEMHELLRQYAEEQLAAVPAERLEVLNRHCDYYARLVQQCESGLTGWRQREALEELGAEIENVRAGWQWALAQRREQAMGQALEGLFYFYYMRSWFQEGAEAFGGAVAALSAPAHGAAGTPERTSLLARALARQGWFLFHLGQHSQSSALLQQSLALLRPLGSQGDVAFALNYLGAVQYHLGQYESATRLLQESLQICQQTGDRYGQSVALNILGMIAYIEGDYPRAKEHGLASLSLKRQIGDRWGTAFSLTNLGTVASAQGEHAEAQQLFQESLAIRRELDDQRGIALCLSHLGDSARALGDQRKAIYLYEQSLVIFREIGNQWGIASTLAQLGDVASANGEYEEARRNFHEALRTATAIQAVSKVLDVLTGLAALASKEQAFAQAVELLTLIVHHPASTKETRQRAEQLLERLTPLAEVEAVSTAQARGMTRVLDVVVAELLRL